MTKGNGAYVKCRIEPGMFSGEWLVYIDAVDPKSPSQKARVQLLVDQRDVSKVEGAPKRNEPAPGWLRVTLVAARGGLASVVLPQPATPFGETVLVRDDLVRESPAA